MKWLHVRYLQKHLSKNGYMLDSNKNICPLGSANYTKFDEAINMAQRLGRGAFFAKSGIKSATRLLPIWSGDFELLGFKFDNYYYYDKCLPFGCSISCSTFEKC